MSNQAIALQQAAAEDPLNLSLSEEAGKSSDQLLEVIKSVSSVYFLFFYFFYVQSVGQESFLGCDCVCVGGVFS